MATARLTFGAVLRHAAKDGPFKSNEEILDALRSLSSTTVINCRLESGLLFYYVFVFV